ncbi:fimbrial protein [Aeromonas sobria]|nr:fimbrial protein [Aeromonas sobria]
MKRRLFALLLLNILWVSWGVFAANDCFGTGIYNVNPPADTSIQEQPVAGQVFTWSIFSAGGSFIGSCVLDSPALVNSVSGDQWDVTPYMMLRYSLPPIGDGYFQLTDELDIRVDSIGGKPVAPDSWIALPNAMLTDGNTMGVSLSQLGFSNVTAMEVSLRVRMSLPTTTVSIPNLDVWEIYGALGSSSGVQSVGPARLLGYKLRPFSWSFQVSCDVNGSNPLEVDFGQMDTSAVTETGGTPQVLVIPIDCDYTGLDGIDVQLRLQTSAIAAFDPMLFGSVTHPGEVGVRFSEQGGASIPPNNTISIPMNQGHSEANLDVQLVRAPGAAVTAGNFEANATIVVTIP